MHEYSDEIISKFMVRKSRKQKEKFAIRVKEMLASEGYRVESEEEGFLRNRNIVVGDVKKAKVIFTAHYDTCALCPFPNFLTSRNILVYIIYQIILVLLILGGATLLGALFKLITGSAVIENLVQIISVWLICIQIMIGFPNKNTYNDNTSGVITLIEIAMNLSEQDREKVAFVFFDNEELGLIGSGIFSKKYGEILKNKLIINFDCVSDGNHLLVVANKQARNDEFIYKRLEENFTSNNEKEVKYVPASTTFYPSDQIKFKKNIAVASMHKAPMIGYYVGRIHTPFDTKFDKRNILLIKDSMIRFIGAFAHE